MCSCSTPVVDEDSITIVYGEFEVTPDADVKTAF